jgi:hypothetical protein
MAELRIKRRPLIEDYRHNPLEQRPLAEPGLTATRLAAKRKLQRVLDALRPAGEAGQSR